MGQNMDERTREIIKYNLISVGLNLVLSVLKLIIGFTVHSRAIALDAIIVSHTLHINIEPYLCIIISFYVVLDYGQKNREDAVRLLRKDLEQLFPDMTIEIHESIDI